MAALDRSPRTCVPSQEFFKNNSLVPPSKPVPQQLHLLPGKKKIKEKIKNPIPRRGYLQGTLH